MNEELQGRIESLRDSYEDLLESLSMTEVTETLGETASTITGIPGKIQSIRDRGYAYANYLENKAETLGRQWEEVRYEIQAGIRTELENARTEMDELDDMWDRLDDMIAGEGEGSISPKRTGGSIGDMIKAAAETAKDAPEEENVFSKLGKMQKAAPERKSMASGSVKAALSSGKAGGSDEAQIEALVGRLEGAMEGAEDFVGKAKERIEGLYGAVPENVNQTLKQISDIESYLDRADEAGFEFLAAEDVYMVVKAEWRKTGKKKQDPDGFFYVTSNRILMEQSEKKGGFMGMGGKKEEGLLWEAPVGSLEDVDFEKKGMLGGIDLIHLTFSSEGPFRDTTIEVKEGLHAKWFASKLKQAASGEIEKERGLERDTATVEAIADAPTMCPVCGATFGQEIVRGMTQLECEYCGAVVRLDV